MPSRIDRAERRERKTPRALREAPQLAVVILPPGQLSRRYLGEAASLDVPGGLGVRPEHLRVVVQHIGAVEAGKVLQMVESVRRAAAGLESFWLTPLRLVSMPRGEAARRVALELDTPAPLLELKRRLAKRLASATRRDAANRFIPRLTLTRLSTPQAGLDIDQTVEAPAFLVDRVSVVETGAVRGSGPMRELACVALGEAAGAR